MIAYLFLVVFFFFFFFLRREVLRCGCVLQALYLFAFFVFIAVGRKGLVPRML